MADNAKGDEKAKKETKSDSTKEPEKKNADEKKEQELVRLFWTNMYNCSDLWYYMSV